ncbi:sugar ABC transporter ATP-binding protein [Nakamurella endophytica]|uniref:Ribose import ATP-binding protein RbsA n=1 Tax=Nakamurella endophytica TaxID=1748367 RepID=A0A917T8R2_9ACTN|nr:sugar ABC transporter ATP-binding protein [Nakamurella endophytica]GGM14646.1 ribose import ATP-binding protein RbsA [Nakamurella endophytica]
MTDRPALRVTDVVKSFGSTTVLKGVSLELEPGSIHGLLGQNGAGKSTLVKIMTGVHGAGSFTGVVQVDGSTVQLTRPQDARQLGIGYVPQEIDVVEHLTVTENVLVGDLGSGLRFDRRAADRRCRTLLDQLGMTIAPRTRVSVLSAAQRQLLMIARALALTPKVLILDEPTTSLTDTEAVALGHILRRLAATGLGILYITHRVREVLDLCDGATVLRDGRVVEQLSRSDLTADRIVTAMAGRQVRDLFPGRRYPGGRTALSVRNLGVRPARGSSARVEDVSFDVHQGEILGIAGLLGAGRSELLAGVFGAVPRTGTVTVGGREVRPGHPRHARSAGIGMLTEERKRTGLLFNMSALRNITIGSLGSVSHRGFLDFAGERRVGRRVIGDLEVKTPGIHSSVEHLSGGNQQKLLIGRTLLPEPSVILLDEPTKGVDVGTRAQIYRLVNTLAERGAALVVVSSELDELLGMCDRFLVLAAGRLVDEFTKGDGSEQRILASIARVTPADEAITT